MSRKSMSKRLRFEIFKRDGFRCLYCGATPMEKVLRVDHVNPVVEGGGDEPENLVTSCFDCNAGKAGVPLERKALPSGGRDEERERAEQIREWLSIQREIGQAKDEVIDQLAEAWRERCGEDMDNMRTRLRRMAEEFPVERLLEAFDIVGSNERLRWPSAQLKYLYGILRKWREEPAQPTAPTPEPDDDQQRAELARREIFERCRAAVAVACGETLDPVRFDSSEERRKHIFKAFVRGALGGPNYERFAEQSAWRWNEFDLRGLRLRFVAAEGGRSQVLVERDADFNPHEYAWQALESVVVNTLVVPERMHPAVSLENRTNEIVRAREDLSRWMLVWDGLAPEDYWRELFERSEP